MEEKQDLRIVKTHKALMDAFLVMLEKKTFDEITVNELCEQAMVRRATFYKHFADKYDFFSFFIRQTRDGFLKEKNKYPESESPYSFCLSLFRYCLIFIKEHEKLIANILKSNALSTLLNIFADEIFLDVMLKLREQAKEGKEYKVSFEVLATFYAGGIIRELQYWLLNRDKMTEEQLLKEVETLFDSLDLIE